MKKGTVLALALAMVISFTACNGEKPKEEVLKTENQNPEAVKILEKGEGDKSVKTTSEPTKTPNESKPGYRAKMYTINEVTIALEQKYLNFRQLYSYEGHDSSGGYCYGSVVRTEEAMKANPPVQINPYTGNYYDKASQAYLVSVVVPLEGKAIAVEGLEAKLEKAKFMAIESQDTISFVLYNMGDPLYEIQSGSDGQKRIVRVNLTTGDVYDFATDGWYGKL